MAKNTRSFVFSFCDAADKILRVRGRITFVVFTSAADKGRFKSQNEVSVYEKQRIEVSYIYVKMLSEYFKSFIRDVLFNFQLTSSSFPIVRMIPSKHLTNK